MPCITELGLKGGFSRHKRPNRGNGEPNVDEFDEDALRAPRSAHNNNDNDDSETPRGRKESKDKDTKKSVKFGGKASGGKASGGEKAGPGVVGEKMRGVFKKKAVSKSGASHSKKH